MSKDEVFLLGPFLCTELEMMLTGCFHLELDLAFHTPADSINWFKVGWTSKKHKQSRMREGRVVSQQRREICLDAVFRFQSLCRCLPRMNSWR